MGSPTHRFLRDIEGIVGAKLPPFTKTRGGHLRMLIAGHPVFLSSTPSSFRSVHDSAALIKRLMREARP